MDITYRLEFALNKCYDREATEVPSIRTFCPDTIISQQQAFGESGD
jgi:hypothetical protein